MGRRSRLNGNDALTAAWVETVWNPALRVDDDAKHQLRRLLAARGMVSQFLATDPPEVTGRQRRSAAALRHARAFALRDLLRGAGVVDHRLANAASADDLVARLDQPAILVGIHARLQQSGGNGKPRLVVRVVALYADGDPTACWPIKMYSDTYGWRPYAPVLADFHARTIGSTEHGRRGAKAEATRLYVASILDALDPGLPVIIFTDAEATRTIWPGIQNGSFCSGAMPGDNLLAAGRDVAIVRCNANDEVPRPVHRVRGGRRPGDPLKPATQRGGSTARPIAARRSGSCQAPPACITPREATQAPATPAGRCRQTLPRCVATTGMALPVPRSRSCGRERAIRWRWLPSPPGCVTRPSRGMTGPAFPLLCTWSRRRPRSSGLPNPRQPTR